jgi:ABC-type Fe3+/spermidine/putrescine transport system ATPase subunit
MLQLRNINFAYDEVNVITDVNLAVANGSHVALIGESGCGKSTLLKLIYGLYDVASGTIDYNGKAVLGPKFRLVPGEDYIKYLAQDFDLMPYISVAENIGKFLSNIYKDEKKARVTELLEMVEMIEFANVKARFLSGGQQQRVALARVLALAPKVLLLDEPFSQIDAFRANSLRRKIFSYASGNQITCIIATHNPADFLPFADQVVVMKNGSIIRSGSPKEIYRRPQTNYVASLFGDVNSIPNFLLGSGENTEKVLVYPHELEVVERSGFAVTVLKSYFNGNTYLVESVAQSGKYLFEHPTELLPGMLVYLARKQ